MPLDACAIVHCARNSVELRSVALPALDTGQVLVQTRYSAISPGTEALVFTGRFPDDLSQDSTIPSLSGQFSYPFTYGYALVGKVIEIGKDVDPVWLSRNVFLFHPHQNYVVAFESALIAIPENASLLDAVFLANMESALNFVMDATPLVGENAVVFGQGVVGMLTAAILERFPLSRLVAVDPCRYRRESAHNLGIRHVSENLATDNDVEFDLAFELSGNGQALNQAIAATGFAGRIVIGSWYGNEPVPLNLGGEFHRKRQRLLSSQVSTIDPALSGRWTKARRLAMAWRWLQELRPECLITHRFRPEQCQQAFSTSAYNKDSALQVIFEYENH